MGNYAGAAADPSDPGAVWVMGEYIAATGQRTWGTYVAQLNFGATTIYAAVLPLSRSVQVGGAPATAFAVIVNSSATTAVNCAPALPPANVPSGLGLFTYQTTTLTNALAGTPNTPKNIAPGA